MLPPPLCYRMTADSLIMACSNRTAYWMFRDAMPKIIDGALTLIVRMWQQAGHLLFSQ